MFDKRKGEHCKRTVEDYHPGRRWTKEQVNDMVQRRETLRQTYQEIGDAYGITQSAVYDIIIKAQIRALRLYGELSDLTRNERFAILALFPWVRVEHITLAFLRELWVNYPRLRLELLQVRYIGLWSVRKIGTLVFGAEPVAEYENAVEYASERHAQEARDRSEGRKARCQKASGPSRVVLVDAAGKRVRQIGDRRLQRPPQWGVHGDRDEGASTGSLRQPNRVSQLSPS